MEDAPRALPLTRLAHERLRAHLREGDVAVDATVGNGHDTSLLAEAVGASGRVYGFDVQCAALRSARARLTGRGLQDRVQLVHAGHERMREYLPESLWGRVAAVTFNLGYLPGGDHSLVTRPVTTLEALAQSLGLLAPSGIVSVLVYVGHPGGDAELRGVEDWLRRLDPAPGVERHAGRSPRSPVLFLIRPTDPGAAEDGLVTKGRP
ncbi:MAG: 16S rRNA (cytosine(1402)-N(4))-methyltransferase [Gammaproteobacteria bacterium]|nr:16S rRNA (cytosine(1402)-N(4))-methyltransferase [Gammaproteobacteria bacterium]